MTCGCIPEVFAIILVALVVPFPLRQRQGIDFAVGVID